MEKIEITIEKQNTLRQEIKNITNEIKNGSDLLIQKIHNSKINYLNILKTIEIILDKKFEILLKDKKEKHIKIMQNKKEIKNLKQLKKDKNHIELIRESKKIIVSEKKEGDEDREDDKKKKRKKREKNKKKLIERENEKEKKKEKEKEKEKAGYAKFDLKMKQNRIKLNNDQNTARNLSSRYSGKVCGKKIYSSGKHEIRIKIDRFPKNENSPNCIQLGVIKTENREQLIKNGDYEGTYFFQAWWGHNKKKLESQKYKYENGKSLKEKYPEKIRLNNRYIFTISLDMDKKKLYFKINEKSLGLVWENLPGKVNFFADLWYQNGLENNQITLL
ncbi:hypothetical protein M0812_17018 [Anaeramoeba flamelloides]|uniref:SPRY domain-containing protein n=1 Tax=Anaeramoeba flamelloides TaxID=1746091 RepID=A0AAV7Z6Y6_9EUKA|nr:hypothetical protein M0812_17018 [Anaeramoeba flamelloides]